MNSEERLKKEKNKRKLDALYKDIFSLEQGKLVLFDIIEQSHILDPRVPDDFKHNIEMNSKRNLGFYIMKRAGIKFDTLDDLLNLLNARKNENSDM